MHICLVASYWPTKANPISGIFIKQQLDAFLAFGHVVSLVLPKGSDTGYLLSDYIGHARFRVFYARCPHLPLRPFPAMTFPLNVKLAGQAIFKQVQGANLRDRVDAVLIHDVLDTLGAIDPVVNDLQIPTFLTLHGEHPTLRMLLQSEKLKSTVAEITHKLTKAILVGNSLHSYADDFSIPLEKRTIIHNGAIDFKPNPEEIQSIRITTGGKRSILSVCNLEENKGLDTVALALAQMTDRRDWIWRIIGDGPERDNIQSIADENGFGDSVQFFGRLSHEQTMTHMAAADVFVMPSRREAFGIVFVEAMKQGKPCLGCYGTGAEEIIAHNQDGFLVLPGDHPEVTKQLNAWLDDPALISKMGTQAAEKGQLFSWEKNSRQFVRLFEEAIQNRRAS